jgi:GWxTD domain-containing protein
MQLPLRPVRLAALAVGLLPLAAVAQPRLPVALSADYATFMYEDEASLLEIYLSVGARSLRYAADPAGGFAAALPVRLALRPTAEAAPDGAAAAAVWSRDADLRFVVQDTAALAAGQFFLDRVRAAVPPGEYTLELAVPADEGARRSEFRVEFDPVVVPDYSADDRAALSGLTLATAIRPGAESGDPFFTNGLAVIPNPNAVFGADGGPLHYYAEAYGIPETSGQAEYTLLAYVAAADEPRPLPGLQQRVARPARDPDVLVGTFDVSRLPSGPYYLRLAALNASNEPLVEQSKRFYVLNPDVEQPLVEGGPSDYEERFFAVVPPEELELMLDQASAVATQPERRQLRALTSDEARRVFLAVFWRARDVDSDPNRNLAREEFGARLRAIERYGVGGLQAWDSDRGRVYLQYGPPAEVDPRPQNTNLVPHEIWLYENIPGQGQAVFVFADREMTSRYELIHSSVTGEVSVPNWEQMLER